MIANEEYYFYEDDWFRTDLTTPIPLDDHNELWIAVDCETWDENIYYIAVDEGPAIDEKGNWRYMYGEWELLEYDGNWCIEAIVQGKWNAELSIISITGPIGVTATIKNIGDAEATTVDWSVKVTGGIAGRINKEGNGTEATLGVGAEVKGKSGIIFGFGKIAVVATASCAEGSSDTENANGLQVLIFSLI